MRKYINSGKFTLILSAIIMLLTNACRYTDKSRRNVEYAPNMFYSIPLEPYKQDAKNTVFADGLNAQKAPTGTIPRAESWYINEAYTPYPYPDNFDGYEAAGASLTSPINNPETNDPNYNCSTESFSRGKRIYETYCINCHGANGNGQGNLVTSGKFGNVPSYSDTTLSKLPVGKMFHTITYGKGIMGSHASQLTQKERWEVICYIQEFQEKGKTN